MLDKYIVSRKYVQAAFDNCSEVTHDNIKHLHIHFHKEFMNNFEGNYERPKWSTGEQPWVKHFQKECYSEFGHCVKLS